MVLGWVGEVFTAGRRVAEVGSGPGSSAGSSTGMVDMEIGQAARMARHDQTHAAQSDVVAILLTLARGHSRWSRIDKNTQGRIEGLLDHLFATAADDGRLCPHARVASFDRAPRPLVLDAAHGILACWEGCYWHRIRSGSPGGPVDATCFDCGQLLTGIVGHDLFIAYGPLLVVGALCPRCRGGSDTVSPPAADRVT